METSQGDKNSEDSLDMAEISYTNTDEAPTLTKTHKSNVIKLPNTSASIPQLVATRSLTSTLTKSPIRQRRSVPAMPEFLVVLIAL